MASSDLLDFFEEKAGVNDRRALADALDRVLTEPQQESVVEALAADAVDAAPVAGDLLALSRQNRAEEIGMEYPSRPAILENAISDLPPPLATIGDLIIAQNTISHLEREKNIPVATALENATEDGVESVQELVDGMLNTSGR